MDCQLIKSGGVSKIVISNKDNIKMVILVGKNYVESYTDEDGYKTIFYDKAKNI